MHILDLYISFNAYVNIDMNNEFWVVHLLIGIHRLLMVFYNGYDLGALSYMNGIKYINCFWRRRVVGEG